MAVNMSEIKKYIYEHGSKQVLNSEYKALFRVIKTGNPRFDQKYFESIKSRISEVLPNEGNIVLSDLDVKIVMHNFGKKGYSEAGFNVAKGQPYIVNEDIIDYKDLIPVSELEIIEFQGSKPVNFREYNEEERMSQASGFLEKIIKVSNFSVKPSFLEIGKNTGDNFSRCFPVRRYCFNKE